MYYSLHCFIKLSDCWMVQYAITASCHSSVYENHFVFGQMTQPQTVLLSN